MFFKRKSDAVAVYHLEKVSRVQLIHLNGFKKGNDHRRSLANRMFI